MKDIAGMRDVACRDARDALRSKKPERIRDLPEDVLDPVEDALVLALGARGLELLGGSAFASCSSSCRCSRVSFFGTDTATRTSRSPRPRPDTSGMPLPRTRNVAPGLRAVGHLDGLLLVEQPGTTTSPPSARVVKFTGISQ